MQMFKAVFAGLPDPRDVNAHHDLTELLFVALAASLCGAQTCAEMAEFGRAKGGLLRQILVLKHGIPSHDTFSRVFRMLDPDAFAAAFARFMAAFGEAARIEAPDGVVAVDGKCLRRGYEAGRSHMPPLLVSARGGADPHGPGAAGRARRERGRGDAGPARPALPPGLRRHR